MSELQFAKQFLTTLDNRNTKYQPDHVFDPKTFATRVPYTLPRLPHPPHPLPPKSGPDAPKAPGAEPATGGESFTVILKSGKNPKLELTMTDLTSATTIQSLKDAVQTRLGGSSVVSTDKVKILLNKKPIPTSKATIGEALAGTEIGREIEMGVMVMGGAPDPPTQAEEIPKPATPLPPSSETGTPAEPAGAPVEQMEGVETTADEVGIANEVMSKSNFWEELENFLAEKLSHGDSARRVRTIFENSYRSSEAAP